MGFVFFVERNGEWETGQPTYQEGGIPVARRMFRLVRFHFSFCVGRGSRMEESTRGREARENQILNCRSEPSRVNQTAETIYDDVEARELRKIG